MPTILITGASRGIGKGIATFFLDQGWNVYGTSTSETISWTHQNYIHFKLDFLEPGAVEEFVKKIQGVTFDACVHNAGIVRGKERGHTFQINAIGPLLLQEKLWKHVATHLKVVGIGSNLGSFSYAGEKFFVEYAASKAAFHKGLQVMARVHPEVEIFILDPGHVQTDIGGIHAPRTVCEVAQEVWDLVCGDTDAKGDPLVSGAFYLKGMQRPW